MKTMKMEGSYTKTQLRNKLNKIAALAVRGSTNGERESATDKLHKLCKKYNLRLVDYVTGLGSQFANIDYSIEDSKKAKSSKSDSTEQAKKEDSSKKANSSKKQSRRGLIIKYLVIDKNKTFTLKTLAELLALYNYNDLKANKKAISGTLYDLQKQGKIKFVKKHENGTIEVIV